MVAKNEEKCIAGLQAPTGAGAPLIFGLRSIYRNKTTLASTKSDNPTAAQ